MTKPKTIPYKRKRQGKTNYRKRLQLLLAQKPRLVVRLTNQRVITQIIKFTPSGDQVLVSADSFALKKHQWNFSCKNLPAAYLTGYLIGKKALQKNIKEALLDSGFRPPLKGNRIYACLKGALDAGLALPHSKETFPSLDRLSGKHTQNDNLIAQFQKTLSSLKDLKESSEDSPKHNQNKQTPKPK